MKKWFISSLGLAALCAGLIWWGWPLALTTMGLHPPFDEPNLAMKGQRALIIATSHNTLGPSDEETGVFLSELTAPYYTLLDSGVEVDIASIKGGPVPIDPSSFDWTVISSWDRRYLDDPQLYSRVQRSFAIAQVDITTYDIVFLAGGWGAAYDFAQSRTLSDKISEAYAAGAVVGGVCHGPLGLLGAQAPNGEPLVKGKRITAVTDKQLNELGISFTPKHPERDLRAAGALFESSTAFRDFFANHVVVDGRLVTGQNQNSGAETAYWMMKTLITDEGGR